MAVRPTSAVAGTTMRFAPKQSIMYPMIGVNDAVPKLWKVNASATAPRPAEILRGSLKKNAIRIDGDGGFAKKEPHCGDGNDPPAIEDATAREKQLVSLAPYRNDSDDPAFCLRGRVTYPGVFK